MHVLLEMQIPFTVFRVVHILYNACPCHVIDSKWLQGRIQDFWKGDSFVYRYGGGVSLC